MVEAETHQRVAQQTLFFDGVVTCFANSIRAVVHSGQRGVHLVEKTREGSIRGGMQGRKKTLAALL
jgi:hypothetical protein